MARPIEKDGVVFRRDGSKFLWMRYRDKDGIFRRESTFTEDRQEAVRKLRVRLDARDQNVLETVRRGENLPFGEWVETFMENYSKPPYRTQKTHIANLRAVKHLKAAFATRKLLDISPDDVESYLRRRMRQRALVKTSLGYREGRPLKPATVHQELRVLRRILNVAVRKRLIPSNPCSGVEFPVAIRGLFRPHYVTWSEQQRIERHSPAHLRNVVRIITETGLRVYKELMPMTKEQVDLANSVLWIPDSKTPSGVAELPLTPMALQALQDQMAIAGSNHYLFPSEKSATGSQRSLRTAWRLTLRRAKIPYFRIYDLRSTYATRLSAGGVADEWVTQLLRQSDSKVFKKYSQMKLRMQREALEKMNRQENEMTSEVTTAVHEPKSLCTVPAQF
jgi:integrase